MRNVAPQRRIHHDARDKADKSIISNATTSSVQQVARVRAAPIVENAINLTKLTQIRVKSDPETGRKYITQEGARVQLVPHHSPRAEAPVRKKSRIVVVPAAVVQSLPSNRKKLEAREQLTRRRSEAVIRHHAVNANGEQEG